ncbi:hypothetical protein M378DRAFT_476159 [Amanita muscaria Koide BX008]|uniref:RNI-like protein n=1 Tax=Amanita muscaria (strain Koide BX008) TaxID=946122 RepID=A0A0C2XNC2_AMAMK|nr:hypothetical protein M378DRAFT_476159 [Amanita muscaria Koide BX008]
MPPRTSKRQRAFGAPSEADSLSVQRDAPSSAASSTRPVPVTTVPSLATLCARKFAANFVSLRNNEPLWEHLSMQLHTVPDTIIPKIFSMLRSKCPTYLKHEIIVTYLLRGPVITLTDALPGVNKKTISDISRINAGVRELEISGFVKIADTSFASVLGNLKSLQVLVLRGCTNVGVNAIAAVAQSCPDLKVINLNYTSANPTSVAQLVNSCTRLECLKVAGIRNWTDATFTKFLEVVGQGNKLANLRTLKVRETQLGDASISALTNLCPNLQRLDASFTSLTRAASLLSPDHIQPLEKLSLTSTSISPLELAQILPLFPQLRVLYLGALGISRGSQASILNTSAMTMDGAGLKAITNALVNSVHLEQVNLVGNSKLGTTTRSDSALADFLGRVGRKCKMLNMAGIPNLRSTDLAGLLPESVRDDSPAIETFILNNTGIDDEAGVYISACDHLQTLAVAGTRITRDGLFPILDACEGLHNLDLTSCRGIGVIERRRFFDIWQEQKE